MAVAIDIDSRAFAWLRGQHHVDYRRDTEVAEVAISLLEARVRARSCLI